MQAKTWGPWCRRNSVGDQPLNCENVTGRGEILSRLGLLLRDGASPDSAPGWGWSKIVSTRYVRIVPPGCVDVLPTIVWRAVVPGLGRRLVNGILLSQKRY